MSEHTLVHAEIKELGEMKLIGLRVLCPGDHYIKEIPKAITLLNERSGEIKHVLNPHQLVGAFFVEERSQVEDGYWICVEVKEIEEVPSGMTSLEIPSQKYAVIRHNGSNHEIGNSYSKLHGWIEEKGYCRLKGTWHLEIHHKWNNLNDLDIELLDTIK
ncbi:GyrI-like domain-containing protein [Bacillus sp. ISL-47]|uniref:GyrI-like domain-containing protein n=1 Tax=Bacillus sp. ISL-47 TaxID=2819130 RepID=UPI001BEAD881|nr:GyrI-like domain-containing protein [Bacillus sp. ISL-47]MBT2691268.1 GyrI-like domain-containing protein [Bacillus sp. ISL-47]MBT2710962.1 GyrI-like domain-containing protein [Pseudomonas sp. ISL-84]